MFVDGVRLKLDVEQYLTARGMRGVKRVGENAMACCPFHRENKPSFGVHVDTGVYNCLGCGARGQFGKLVKHLEKHDTVWDAERSLVMRFGEFRVEIDAPLELDFKDQAAPAWMDESVLVDLRWRHSYLEQRGISELWQRRFEVGYDPKKMAVTFPWRDAAGHLVIIKYRSVVGKQFWYSGVAKKSHHLYGFHHVKRRRDCLVCITESETDCLYLWQAGHPAIAIGGSSLSDEQVRLLSNSTIEELVIFTDNDEAGRKALQQIALALSSHMKVTGVDWRLFPDKKDANELTLDEASYLVSRRQPVPLEVIHD